MTRTYEEFLPLREFLNRENIAHFPGGLGTQLRKQGVPDGTIASLTHPKDLAQAHGEYADKGSSFVIVDTFDLSPWRLAKTGREHLAGPAIAAAYHAARSVHDLFSDRPLYVGASITVLNDCYEPDEAPKDDDLLLREHKKTIALHAQHNPDFLCLETIPGKREALAMVKAAGAFHLPFIISFTVDKKGNLLDGTPIEEIEELTRSPYRVGIGTNCCQIEGSQEATSKLARVFNDNAPLIKQHIVAYPNGFAHSREEFAALKKHNPDIQPQVLSHRKFTEVAQNLRDRGATIVGGCCGADSGHIGAFINQSGGRLQRRLVA
jgi:S-methylmethionine-dependent homocysteine/selenocysteine methylase